jgi:hypothetical protein
MHASKSRSQTEFFTKILRALGWTPHSYYLLSGFVLTLFLLGYIWWPLAEEYLSYIDWQGRWWLYLDWLLLGIFLVMSLLIMAGADLRVDIKIIIVGLIGGLVIESWGTQTNLWHYYTAERPPLWIIPAWPIASLSIDRLVRVLQKCSSRVSDKVFRITYWAVFPVFNILMLYFVRPTLDKSLTLCALGLVSVIIITPTNHRLAVLTFVAGAGLGYFLERWGTTRECWTYYTFQTPPVFAVFAHGMAAVAFWRSLIVLGVMMHWVFGKLKISRQRIPSDTLTGN